MNRAKSRHKTISSLDSKGFDVTLKKSGIKAFKSIAEYRTQAPQPNSTSIFSSPSPASDPQTEISSLKIQISILQSRINELEAENEKLKDLATNRASVESNQVRNFYQNVFITDMQKDLKEQCKRTG